MTNTVRRKLIIVDLPTFWEKMCHPHFWRIDLNRGAIGSTMYWTNETPETEAGFLPGKIERIGHNLGLLA
jgi:hypothetical protein